MVGGEGLVSSGVDGEDHPLLAVIRLTAIHPDGVGVLDGEPRDDEVVRLVIWDRDAREHHLRTKPET